MNCGSITVKYLLFAFNLLFVLCGVTLIVAGVVIKSTFKEYEIFLDDRYLSAPSLLISTGAIIFFIAFFGCCGAVKENHCMVVTFGVLLGAVFVMEIVACVTGYALKEEVSEVLSHSLKKSMQFYNESETKQLWDTMQRQLGCCGANNYTDWKIHDDELPMSCCMPEFGIVGKANCTYESKNIYTTSCVVRLGESIRDGSGTIGIVALCVSLVQIFGVVFSYYLAKSIKASSYESV